MQGAIVLSRKGVNIMLLDHCVLIYYNSMFPENKSFYLFRKKATLKHWLLTHVARLWCCRPLISGHTETFGEGNQVVAF